jgi:hypothetical protein
MVMSNAKLAKPSKVIHSILCSRNSLIANVDVDDVFQDVIKNHTMVWDNNHKTGIRARLLFVAGSKCLISLSILEN